MTEPHRARDVAESFGVDAARYDRSRPRYPSALVGRLVARSPGPAVLDVGCGTGIAARQLQRAGCTVLGVEPDERMAAFARSTGVPVEVAAFEEWDPEGRSFDLVVAAQSWHWVHPVEGPRRAAQVLTPGGVLAVLGHVLDGPPEVAAALVDALREIAPDAPLSRTPARPLLEVYEEMFARFADGARRVFDAVERDQDEAAVAFTRQQWLDLTATTGALTSLTADQRQRVLERVGGAVDRLGGSFSRTQVTLSMTARRRD